MREALCILLGFALGTAVTLLVTAVGYALNRDEPTP